MNAKFLSTLAIAGAAACATVLGGPNTVSLLLDNADSRDGQRVNVGGTLVSSHGLMNLYSSDRRECVGLLITDEQRASYLELEGRDIAVSGVFRAQGCGRDGICDEHLCAPGILVDVSLQP